MTTKVWLLCVGEYSSYRVVAVFDDARKKQAERIAEMIGGSVDGPYSLNGFEAQCPPIGMKFFEVDIRRDGKATVRLGRVLDENGKRQETYNHLFTHDNRPHERRSHWLLVCRLYAKSEEHAVKIANELRVQILAGVKPDNVEIPSRW